GVEADRVRIMKFRRYESAEVVNDLGLVIKQEMPSLGVAENSDGWAGGNGRDGRERAVAQHPAEPLAGPGRDQLGDQIAGDFPPIGKEGNLMTPLLQKFAFQTADDIRDPGILEGLKRPDFQIEHRAFPNP